MWRKQIIDVTGTPLTPSRQGRKCLGNGEHPEYECCCDECDYYLYCFPEEDWRLERNKFNKMIKIVFSSAKQNYKKIKLICSAFFHKSHKK